MLSDTPKPHSDRESREAVHSLKDEVQGRYGIQTLKPPTTMLKALSPGGVFSHAPLERAVRLPAEP